jgi:Tir chaperone protein (CesT) family
MFMNRPKLQEFIHKLCDDLEIDTKPTINEKLEYTFSLLDDIELYMIEFEDHAFIRCNIAELKDEKKAELLAFLMNENFLGQGTGRTTIGIDESEKNLTLSLLMPYELNYIFFKEKIEDFVNFVYYLRDEITKFFSENITLL